MYYILQDFRLFDPDATMILDALRNNNFTLCGKVYNHPRFDNGHWIRTSFIVGYDAENKTFITNSGSRYMLGEGSLEDRLILHSCALKVFGSDTVQEQNDQSA